MAYDCTVLVGSEPVLIETLIAGFPGTRPVNWTLNLSIDLAELKSSDASIQARKAALFAFLQTGGATAAVVARSTG